MFAVKRAMVGVGVEFGLTGQRRFVESNVGGPDLVEDRLRHGTHVLPRHFVIDRFGIGGRGGGGLAFRGENRPGIASRFGFVRKVFGTEHVGLGQFVQLGLDLVMAALRGRTRDDHRQQAAQPAAALCDLFLVLGLERFVEVTLHFFRLVTRLGRGELCRFESGQFRDFDIEIEFLGNPREDRRRLGHAAGAELAAGHRAFIRVHHRDARLAQPVGIALGRLVFPHLHVHRGNGKHGLVGREDQRGGEIVGDPGGHLGQQIGRRRAHDHEIGLAAELDMPHLDLVLEVEERSINLVFRQRGECHRGDELLPAFGQHAGHRTACLADQADQFARFVSGNAAADDEQDLRPAHAVRPFACVISARFHADRRVHSHKAIDALASAPRPSLPALNTGVFRDSP